MEGQTIKSANNTVLGRNSPRLSPHRKTSMFSAKMRSVFEPWLYLSPAIILLVLVMFLPLVIGFTYSFQHYSLFRPNDITWAGFANFEQLWSDWKFWKALKNTVWWTFGSVSIQFILGLGLALLLNRTFPARRLIQALVFLPWAVPTFLSGLTWAWLFNPVIGPLPKILYAVGLTDSAYESILADPAIAMWGPITANVWFGIPFFAITLLAALQSIPKDLYEAAAMDGASAWQGFTKITLPFLAPMIAITVMLRTIWIANFPDFIYTMTKGGPANSTEIVATYIFTTAFRRLDFGYASAVAMVLLLLLLAYAFILLNMRRIQAKG